MQRSVFRGNIRVFRILAIAVTALAMVVCAPVAGAATFAVNTLSDIASDGACDADCTIRDAIGAAGAGDTVELPAGQHDLSSELVVTQSVTIVAANLLGARPVIDGGNSTRLVRITGGTVTFRHVTLQHGQASALSVGGGVGGAVLHLSGALTLNDVLVDANTATTAGNAYGGGVASITGVGRTVTVTNATFTNNVATSTGAGVSGGGLYVSDDATVTITGSDVGSNMATSTSQGADGAGIALLIDNGSSTITDTSIHDNSATGVPYATGAGLTLGTSTPVSPSYTLTRVTVDANAASSSAGGGIASGGGINTTVATTVIDSTISNNSAAAAAGDASGGGIAAQPASASDAFAMINVTVAGNSAAGGTSDNGGGVFFDVAAGATGSIAFSTVASNTGGDVSGIAGAVTIDHTIVSGNTGGTQCDAADSAVNGFNLLFTGGCGGTGDATDVITTNAVLGTLQLGGGTTKTMTPKPWSPAIDAGGAGPCGSGTDQNGDPRPTPTTDCDIGAVETEPGDADVTASVTYADTEITTTSAGSVIVFTNIGSGALGGPLQGAPAVLAGANAADFSITADSCTNVASPPSVVIAPAATCSITVTFTPSALGARTATLTATFSDGTGESVALSGTGLPHPPSCNAVAGSAVPGQTITIATDCPVTGTADAPTSFSTGGIPAGWTVNVVGTDLQVTVPLAERVSQGFTYTGINDGGSSTVAANVTVVLPNVPACNAVSGSAVPGQTITIATDCPVTGTADAPDTYSTAGIPAGWTVNIVGTDLQVTVPLAERVSQAFTYDGTNIGGTSPPAAVNVTVVLPNVPACNAVSGSATPGETITVATDCPVTGTADAPDTIAVSSVPAGWTVNVVGSDLQITIAVTEAAGPQTFNYSGTNIGGTSPDAAVNITVNVPVAPVCTSTSASVARGNTVTVALSCTAFPTGYAISGSVPSGWIASISGSDMLVTAPAAESAPAVIAFTATNLGGTSALAAVTVTSTGLDPPVCSGAIGTVNPGLTVTLPLSCTNNPTSYTLVTTALPAGWTAAISGSNLVVTVPANRVGFANLSFRAANAAGNSNEAVANVTIVRTKPPVVDIQVTIRGGVRMHKTILTGCTVDIGSLQYCDIHIYVAGTLLVQRKTPIPGIHDRALFHNRTTLRGRRVAERRFGGITGVARLTARTNDGYVVTAQRPVRVVVPVQRARSKEPMYAGRGTVPTVAGKKFAKFVKTRLKGASVVRITCAGFSSFGETVALNQAKDTCARLKKLGIDARFSWSGHTAVTSRTVRGRYTQPLDKRVDVIVRYR